MGGASPRRKALASVEPRCTRTPTANAYGLQIPWSARCLTGSVIEEPKICSPCDDPLSITQAKVDTALSKLNSPGNGLRWIDGGIDQGRSLAIFTNTFLDMGAVPTVDASPRRRPS